MEWDNEDEDDRDGHNDRMGDCIMTTTPDERHNHQTIGTTRMGTTGTRTGRTETE